MSLQQPDEMVIMPLKEHVNQAWGGLRGNDYVVLFQWTEQEEEEVEEDLAISVLN